MTDRQSSWFARLVRNLLLWLAPVYLIWSLATPAYNHFLVEAAENLTRLSEASTATRFRPHDAHRAVVLRADRPVPGLPYSIRVTDVHFNAVLMTSLFLAVPGVGWRRRLSALGTAGVFLACFHVVDLFFWIKFVYATQLGAWSTQNFGPLAQNFWGLGKHVLDLPVKLGLPLLLWCGFFFDELSRTRV